MEDSYVLQLQEPKFREFYLSYSGYAQCGPLHCYGPASRPHYLIHFVVKGKGMYQVSGQKHYLTAGQGFLLPRAVEISVSNDNKAYTMLATVENDVPFDFRQDCYRTFGWTGESQGRYIRLKAFHNGHPGGWIFTDEIIVE